MKRSLWLFLTLLCALSLGTGVGLYYAWVVAPRSLTDSQPAALRSDFKDQFRAVIAASYAATGNLPRAQARLTLLEDSNPIEALNAQAQRAIAVGEFLQADQITALALALENEADFPAPFSLPPTSDASSPGNIDPTVTPFPSPDALSFVFTGTPEILAGQTIEATVILNTPTPRPTRTPIPTYGAPFRLVSQEAVCNPNLPDGLLQIVVYNSSRRQLAGVKVIITWDTGGEEFFTGFKPELGNGYADFLMLPDTSHAVQLALGSEIAVNLVPPVCQTPGGDPYLGGYKLTFQQP
jgi:hypothetical protein